jgi:hypothetical protein
MTRDRFHFIGLAALTAAGTLAAASAHAVPPPPAPPQRVEVHPPDTPSQRTGSYKVTKRGAKLVHATCDEGGHVWVPKNAAHPLPGGAKQTQDAALRNACKSVDYTK